LLCSGSGLLGGRLLRGRLLRGGLLGQRASGQRKHKRDKHFFHFKSLLHSIAAEFVSGMEPASAALYLVAVLI
jgi:hypothetical protein